MKGTVYFFRHIREPLFIKNDGSTTDSILDAVGFLREPDADAFMLSQNDATDMCEMPVWEWIAACNDARDVL